MYYRKKEDAKRFLRAAKRASRGYPYPAYYDERKRRWIRCWKSDTRSYGYEKRQSRKALRRMANHDMEGRYGNKSYDLWWNVW